jgi:hypothetical protein
MPNYSRKIAAWLDARVQNARRSGAYKKRMLSYSPQGGGVSVPTPFWEVRQAELDRVNVTSHKCSYRAQKKECLLMTPCPGESPRLPPFWDVRPIMTSLIVIADCVVGFRIERRIFVAVEV